VTKLLRTQLSEPDIAKLKVGAWAGGWVSGGAWGGGSCSSGPAPGVLMLPPPPLFPPLNQLTSKVRPPSLPPLP